MRPFLSMIFCVIIILSCTSDKKKEQTILFDVLALPCDVVDQQTVAKFFGLTVTDIIFQNVRNTATQKICTYYKNVQPQTLPLINLTVEPLTDVNATQDVLFAELIKNGISGSGGISKFKKLQDDRFNAVTSDSNLAYNTIYLEVKKQALVIIEYDKSLIKDSKVDDFDRKLIELFLYTGPMK